MNLKNIFVTTFIKQNKWHKHSVLIHTLKVSYVCLKNNRYDLFTTALLHDIGKPLVAFQDEKDIILDTYSFTNHEEKSYQIIKNIPFISTRTKTLVRYHYLIRDIVLKKKKGNLDWINKQKIWDSLDNITKKDLEVFLKFDDLGKI